MAMKGWPCHSPKSVTEATKGWHDAGRDARLVEEHLDELALAAPGGVDALDGHQAAEPVGPSRQPRWTEAMPPLAISGPRR